MIPLKEATSEKHKLAERMPFNVKMFKGFIKQRRLFAVLSTTVANIRSHRKKGFARYEFGKG
jgi:hypothetical protein